MDKKYNFEILRQHQLQQILKKFISLEKEDQDEQHLVLLPEGESKSCLILNVIPQCIDGIRSKEQSLRMLVSGSALGISLRETRLCRSRSIASVLQCEIVWVFLMLVH